LTHIAPDHSATRLAGFEGSVESRSGASEMQGGFERWVPR